MTTAAAHPGLVCSADSSTTSRTRRTQGESHEIAFLVSEWSTVRKSATTPRPAASRLRLAHTAAVGVEGAPDAARARDGVRPMAGPAPLNRARPGSVHVTQDGIVHRRQGLCPTEAVR
ncbi:hypothetical protein [Streptomyces avermitilis]|uniref:hypothetical protein n=1 Tax=Streptomyces avermitilis TaxID=33903 RepID=UPI0033B40557